MTDKPETGPRSSDLRKHVESIVELTTRVDERVRGIVKEQEAIAARLDHKHETLNEHNARIKVLEAQLTLAVEDKRLAHELKESLHELELKVGDLEKSTTNQEQRWKTIMSFAIQLIWVILAAYLLYKLGIQSPSTP